jgi:acyl carrier protein
MLDPRVAARSSGGGTRSDLTPVHVAAWLCRLRLTPDAVIADRAGEGAARALGRMLNRPVPLVQACDRSSVVLCFGDAAVLRARLLERASGASLEAPLVVPIMPAGRASEAVLDAVGLLFTLGFDPDWLTLYGRGSVVSLPVHTWHRPRVSSAGGATPVATWIRRQLGEIVPNPVDAEDDRRSLISLGVDSLFALDLEERLRVTFGVDLSILRALDELTVASLVERVIAAQQRREVAHA